MITVAGSDVDPADGLFVDGTAFLPKTSVDTGEVDDVLLAEIDGTGRPELILLSETAPATSPSSEHARVFDWKR